MTMGDDGSAEEEMDFGDTGAEEPGMVRLFINIGKKQKAKPGDILGALCRRDRNAWKTHRYHRYV